MKTTASNLKVRQIVTSVRDGKLLPRPAFQRRSVWTLQDKLNFIDSVIKGYPFPEIYLADGEVDTTSGEGTQMIVDGQQRVTTLSEYFSGILQIPANSGFPDYKTLTEPQQKGFLSYDVAYRDLGDLKIEQIKEVFRRINMTSYNLNEMEINNAVYGGELKNFCEELTSLRFFEDYKIFRPLQIRRMGDVKYVLTIIVTMIEGYFNRDQNLEKYLETYSDQFDQEKEMRRRFDSVLAAIKAASFDPKSRAFKQADLFTLIVECDRFLCSDEVDIQLGLKNVASFYQLIEHGNSAAAIAYRSGVLQAANDRGSRVRRGLAIEHALRGTNMADLPIEALL